MTVQVILGVSLLAIIAAVVICCLFRAHLARSTMAALPKAPDAHFLFGNLPQLQTNPHQVLYNWSHTLGPVFQIRLGVFNAVVLSSTASIYEALVKHAARTSSRPRISTFEALNRGVLSSFTLQPMNKKWKLMRKIAVRALGLFSTSRNARLEEICGRLQNVIVRQINDNLDKPMDITQVLFECIAAVMGTICFGYSFDYGDAGLKEFLRISKENSALFGLQNYAHFLPFSQYFLKPQFDRLTKNRGYVNEFVGKRLIAYNKATNGEVQTVAEALHRAVDEAELVDDQKQQEQSTLVAGNIKAIATDLFAAGYTTVMDTVRWALLLMATHHDVQQRVFQEIQETLRSDGYCNKVQLRHMDDMLYVKATLAEVYRFAPSVPLGIFHSVDETMTMTTTNVRCENGNSNSTTASTMVLPKDTILIPNIWAAHRNPKLFERPFRFNPERFLIRSNNDNEIVGLNQKLINETLPFGYGKRRCPGENLARQEVFLFFTALLQRYQIRLDSEIKLDNSFWDGEGGLFLKPVPHQLIFSVR